MQCIRFRTHVFALTDCRIHNTSDCFVSFNFQLENVLTLHTIIVFIVCLNNYSTMCLESLSSQYSKTFKDNSAFIIHWCGHSQTHSLVYFSNHQTLLADLRLRRFIFLKQIKASARHPSRHTTDIFVYLFLGHKLINSQRFVNA